MKTWYQKPKQTRFGCAVIIITPHPFPGEPVLYQKRGMSRAVCMPSLVKRAALIAISTRTSAA
ncbi:hypothetical protein RRG08_048036 [Elysia crispata]|uniref:Uncharacterized protein n=1 Tax=Elysia crispata TaxID=231223 RepID=A0AAE1D8Y7_9GAST|nr:hypothetical protein RRG08_048036 [Elysia crispata]